MLYEFIVRNDAGVVTVVNDLGLTWEVGESIDLLTRGYDIETIVGSADLETKFNAGDLVRVIDSVDVAAADAFQSAIALSDDVLDALQGAASPDSANPFATINDVSGGGLTPGTHRSLDQLVHGIAETSFDEVIRTGNQVTDVITWTSNLKTLKIRESTFTYTGNQVTTVVTKQYDGAGVVVETITETIAYTGNQVDDITRTLT